MVNVVLRDLPCKVKGFSVKNGDGTYTVMINSIHTVETMRNTFEHELDHIENGHLDEEVDVSTIEKEIRRKL